MIGTCEIYWYIGILVYWYIPIYRYTNIPICSDHPGVWAQICLARWMKWHSSTRIWPRGSLLREYRHLKRGKVNFFLGQKSADKKNSAFLESLHLMWFIKGTVWLLGVFSLRFRYTAILFIVKNQNCHISETRHKKALKCFGTFYITFAMRNFFRKGTFHFGAKSRLDPLLPQGWIPDFLAKRAISRERGIKRP